MKIIRYITLSFFIMIFHTSCVLNNSFRLKNTSDLQIKKLWIKESVLKDLRRPSVAQTLSPVLTSFGTVVQGDQAKGLQVYTTQRGKNIWSFPVSGGLSGGVLYANNKLFFGGADGFFYALKADTGDLLWKIYTGLSRVSTPLWNNRKLYFSGDKGLYVVYGDTGKTAWSYSVDVAVNKSKIKIDGIVAPVIHDNGIYFKTIDNFVFALDLSGRLKWKRRLFQNPGQFFISSGMGLASGKVGLYVSSPDSGLHCLNYKTGKTIWNTSKGSYENILVFNTFVVYPSEDGYIYALDQKSGKQIWMHKIDQPMATSLVSYKNTLIYGEYSGDLKILSKETGKSLASFSFGTGMSAPPVVSESESAVYFMSNKAWLYKLSVGF